MDILKSFSAPVDELVLAIVVYESQSERYPYAALCLCSRPACLRDGTLLLNLKKANDARTCWSVEVQQLAALVCELARCSGDEEWFEQRLLSFKDERWHHLLRNHTRGDTSIFTMESVDHWCGVVHLLLRWVSIISCASALDQLRSRDEPGHVPQAGASRSKGRGGVHAR